MNCHRQDQLIGEVPNPEQKKKGYENGDVANRRLGFFAVFFFVMTVSAVLLLLLLGCLRLSK